MGKPIHIFLLLLLFSFVQSSCKTKPIPLHSENRPFADEKLIYQSEELMVKQLSNHIFLHQSYLQTDDFGKVECNGMVVVNENKAIVLDTPTNNIASKELIDLISNRLKYKILGVVPTHFHEDCVGGINDFEKHEIPVIISKQTVLLLMNNGHEFTQPLDTFIGNKNLSLGNANLLLNYFGSGHTKDNVVAYFPPDKALFGGCLIKSLGAGKGYLGDANIEEWSNTVTKVKNEYLDVEIVIPGHGKWGNTDLLDYTISLFKE